MAFVLQNKDNGKYVSPAGGDRSYTSNISLARRWSTRIAADEQRCGNERIVEIMGDVKWR